MTTFGLGVDDASQALTVSRAVKRAMNERGLSAVEAIEDLSSKLNISNLVTSGEPQKEEHVVVNTSRPSSPQQQRPAPAPTLSMADRTFTTLQRKRKASNKPSTHHKNAKQKKNQSRKRPAPTGNEKFSSSRERADSVTEAVEAKAKKARHSPEDSPSPADTDAAPIIVRAKRTSAHRGAEQPQDSHSV